MTTSAHGSLRDDRAVLVAGAEVVTCGRPSRATSFAYRCGRLVAVGGRDEVRSALGPSTCAIVDLGGRTVVPGFNDSHNHMQWTGLSLAKVQLRDARSIEDVLARIARRTEHAAPGTWIECSPSWHESKLAERRLPTRFELDRAAPANPVYVPRGGHLACVNSAALAEVGWTDATPDPPGGRLGRDARGGLTGEVFERPALARLVERIPAPTPAQRRDALRRAMVAYNAAGITSVRDPGLRPDEWRAYQELWAERALTVRTTGLVRCDPSLAEHEQRAELEAWGVRSGFGDDWLRLGALKFSIDGGIETAAMVDDYASRPGFRGVDVFEPGHFARLVRLANRLGWQVATHIVGDRAAAVALSAYEDAHGEHSLHGRRWSLEHCMQLRDEDLPRVRAMQLVLAHQHPLVYALGANIVKHWGRERAERVSRVRSWLEAGVPVAGGSDSMVAPFEPLLGIWGCVTRATDQGDVLGADQRIAVDQALRIYTTGGAYVTFEDDRKGTLTPGRLADFVVLDGDPTTCDPEAIRRIPVAATVVGGQIVHDPDGLFARVAG